MPCVCVFVIVTQWLGQEFDSQQFWQIPFNKLKNCSYFWTKPFGKLFLC